MIFVIKPETEVKNYESLKINMAKNFNCRILQTSGDFALEYIAWELFFVQRKPDLNHFYRLEIAAEI